MLLFFSLSRYYYYYHLLYTNYDYLHVQCHGHHYRVVRSALRRRWSISKYSLEHTYVSRNTSLSRGLMSRPSRNSRIQARTKVRGHEEDNVSVTFRTETIDQFWDKYGSVKLQPAPIQIAFSIIQNKLLQHPACKPNILLNERWKRL